MSINKLNLSHLLDVNSVIIEWDMRRAGLSLIKDFKLLPSDRIEYLGSLSKSECDITIGKMQIKDREFSKNLEQAFTDAMLQFLEANQIDQDLDVISIKKDACFVINKAIKHSKFGEYIEFVPKNRYHAYMYISPFLKIPDMYATPMELYFKKNDEIDIKGLTSIKEERLRVMETHKDGILNFLNYVVHLMETTNLNRKEVNRFLHEFVSMYKNRELEYDYYREFNLTSRFRYRFAGSEIMALNIDDSMLEKVDIRYNYVNIILPLINLII